MKQIGTLLVMLLLGSNLMAQPTRNLSELSDVELDSHILSSLWVRNRNSNSNLIALNPKVSTAALTMLLEEIRKGMDVAEAMPRYGIDAMCDTWQSSTLNQSDRITAALDAYDQAELDASLRKAEPVAAVLPIIENQLDADDLRAFRDYMNEWRRRYRSGSGSTGSFFSTVLRNNQDSALQNITHYCGL